MEIVVPWLTLKSIKERRQDVYKSCHYYNQLKFFREVVVTYKSLSDFAKVNH